MEHIQIVIDDGSNFIKSAVFVDGSIINESFPSRVIRSAISSVNGFSNLSYQVDNKTYSVSDTGADCIPTNTREYQTSDANAVLIHYALHKTNAKTADVVLTLPVSQFFNPDGSTNKPNIAAKITNAKKPVINLAGLEPVKLNKVFVMPEGVPGFLHAKKTLELESGRYLMIDIGGTTTDLIVFDSEDNITEFISLPVGALSMLNRFKSLVIARLNLNDITDAIALKGLLTGLVAGVDVKGDAVNCIDKFKATINDNITRYGDLALFDGVIYSGGGAELLGDVNGLKTKTPQYDNALGCLDIFEG